jgi:aspartokinase
MSEERSFVSVVGDGLLSEGRSMPLFLRALKDASITTHAIRATPLRLSAVVPTTMQQDAERALHAALVRA